MDVITRQQGMYKSLPAELVVGGGHGLRRLMQNGEVMQHRGMRGVGDYTAEEWAQLLNSTTAATLPLLIAQNPGTLYTTNPQTGQITVYAQPSGSNVNLPVGVINAGGPVAPGASGTVSTALGTASVSGINSTTILLGGAVLVLLYMMMQRGR